MNYSLYLIGSKARGDDNIHSDIDYVCLYEGSKPRLELEGGSVSYYSIARMQWMIRNSKLFVKHLLQEGKPISEKKEHRRLLDSFVLNTDILEGDRKEFIHFIDSLVWIPPSTAGLRWGCDYIYTIARNIIYITNGFDGFFQFGYGDAVLHFLKMHAREDLLPVFMKLREEKYKYRNNDLSPTDFNLSSLNDILSVLADQPISLVTHGVSRFSHQDKVSYEVLRLLERAIINGELADEGYVQKLKNHGEYFFALRESAQKLCAQLHDVPEY